MKEIALIPYIKRDGIPTFRNSEIRDIYTRVKAEGWVKVIFDDGYITNAEDFERYITSPDVLFWGVYYGEELIGFCYVNRIEKTHAYLHFGFFKKWWGRSEVINEAGRQGLEILLVKDYEGKPMFELLMGMYPSWNVHVLAYVHKFGAHTVTKVPHLIWSESQGKSVEGTIVSITREDLE
ncbi:hypothetical protein KA005_25145 [bacterium]|nr:hypothetical protein [bacterium]